MVTFSSSDPSDSSGSSGSGAGVSPCLDWDHVYLLGWFQHGRAYLTTYAGYRPKVTVVVRTPGCSPPMWAARVPAGCELVPVPPETDASVLARQLGGVVAFGWYLAEGMVRS
jgi:hypothetical protein